MTRVPQRAFAGGILSPGMYARTDISKWNQGLKDAENIVLRAEGGANSRAGTILAGGFDNSTVDGHQWIVPFEASEDDTYMLEFGDEIMRVMKSGAYVLDSSITAQTIASLETDATARLEMSSSAAANEFTIGALAYVNDPDGTSVLHQQIVKITARTSEFLEIEIVGGAVPDTTSGSWGSLDGTTSTLSQVYQLTSPFAIEDMPSIQFTQDVDTMFFTAAGYDPRQLVRTADDEWAFSLAAVGPEINSPGEGGFSASITAAAQADPVVVSVSSNLDINVGDRVKITDVVGMTALNDNVYQVNNIIVTAVGGVVTNIDFELEDLSGVDIDGTAFGAYTSGGTVTAAGAYASTGSGAVEYKYKIAAVNGETGEESLPTAELTTTNDLTTSGNQNTIFWPSVTVARTYRVYKDFNGIFGFIGVTEATEFVDENITPDTADTPQTDRDPFSGASDKPSVCAFVDARLTFAASANNPQVVEMSSSTSPLNFNRSLTPAGSDAVSFRMRSQKLNRVQHIVDAQRPIIFTAGAEWYIDTGDDAGVQPGNFALRAVTYRGSASNPPPVTVGEMILHVTRSGNTVREFNLTDATREEASADVTLLARHLFRGKTIKSMAYSQSPDSIVWLVLETGELYSLTYLPEHEVWGWTKHRFGGTDVKVKQVAVVTEGAYDTPYFVVERTLYGGTVTLIERMDTREFTDVTDCYFVDCGLKYEGAAATALGGYLHLRGEDIEVLADGNVLEGRSVDSTGNVALGGSYSQCAVGLGYDSYIVLLDGDLGDQIRELGSSMGRQISADEVAVKTVDTRGIAVGLEGDTLNEVKEFTGASPIPLATKTEIVTIEGDWSIDQAIEVRQVYPLPMTITAVGPSWTLGG